MIQQAVSPECEPEAKRIPALLRCYLRCPSSPHAALGACFLSLPTGSLRLNSNPYAPRQAAALGTLRTHFLVVLLEALLREDSTCHRVRLAFPCDGSDLVVACFILPRPVQSRPSLGRHLLGVLVTVELESLRRRREVESFVQFLPHVPFPWSSCFPAPHQ